MINNEMPLISIIVPIYKVENYIDECVESLLRQTYTNIEILLVDDGSPDNCGMIIDNYEKIDHRIKALHKQNGGLSDARNYGIINANGIYLMFVDGDDYLSNPDSLEKILKQGLVGDPDIIQYKKKYVYDNGKKKEDGDYPKVVYQNVFVALSILNRRAQVSVSACDKLIKRSLIVDNDNFFEKGLLCEDVLWSYKLFLKAKSMTTVNVDAYSYRQGRNGSITTTQSKNKYDSLNYIVRYWFDYSYSSRKMKSLYYNMIMYWYLILRTDFDKKYYSEDDIVFFKHNDNRIRKYHQNYKVNIAYKVSKVFGVRMSIRIMKVYLSLKKAGILRIAK